MPLFFPGQFSVDLFFWFCLQICFLFGDWCYDGDGDITRTDNLLEFQQYVLEVKIQVFAKSLQLVKESVVIILCDVKDDSCDGVGLDL